MALTRLHHRRASPGSVLALLVAALGWIGLPAPAWGEAPPVPAAAEAGDGPAPAQVQPPVPIGSVEVPWPEGAPPPQATIEVEVVLQVDEQGQVADVRLVRGAGAPWDQAVIDAAASFRFEPARWGSEPVAVEIPFVQRFTPPVIEPREEETGPELAATIVGEVIEMGTRLPVPSPEVLASAGDSRYRAEGDGAGHFSLQLPAGAAEVEVVVPGYLRFVVAEELAPGQKLQVRYLVQRISHHPFEQTVIGKPTRQEVTRTTLRDRELHRVPGTFGDPFRVISTMPGVGQVFSLLDYPIIRGASPGSSGILLDGDPIPQLFHFLAGPAVIHPSFIERIDFYPGAFPLAYGGYTGGIVDGITREARPEDATVEVGADLLKSSLLLRQEVLGTQATIAGRYGYPGMLLGLASNEAFMSYWDYQARLDGRAGGGRWSVFAYGSFDEFGEIDDGVREVALQTLFHRLSLRWSNGDPTSFDRYELGLGLDRSLTGSEPVDEADLREGASPSAGYSLGEWMLHPRARWRRPLTDDLSIHGGLGLQWRRTESTFSLNETDEDLLPPNWSLRAGAFLELPWWLTEDLLLVPGTRFDLWETDQVRRFSVDPRLNLRWRASEAERTELWLKAGVGIFHQPPRPPIPIPGVTALLLEEGLPAALQTTLGAELDLQAGWFFDVQTYFNFMEPIFLDLEVNGTNAGDMGGYADAYSSGLTGRSFGVEVLLRRKTIGNFFGWVSYTLSRSERLAPDGWKAFDFDRTHMLQFVGSLRLPRDWELGSRLQLASGRPISPWDQAIERAPLFARLDFRIDRRVVYRSWMLDFYVELINVTLSREQVAEGSDSAIPYIFPTVGFRAVL